VDLDAGLLGMSGEGREEGKEEGVVRSIPWLPGGEGREVEVQG
jgi:hypothetical protein